MKLLHSKLQEWLIALALLITVPTAVFLGCRLLSPKIDYNAYSEEYAKFFEGISPRDKENRKKREQKFEQTNIFKEHQEKICTKTFIYVIGAGVFSCGAFYFGSIFIMPVISAAMIYIGLILNMMYSSSYYSCTKFHDIGLFWIELLFVITSFVIVVIAAYHDSKR